MIIPIIILGVAAILASGILFPHRRMLTFLGAAGALWQVGWLLLTLIDRTLLQEVSSQTVFVLGSAILLAIFAWQYKQWKLPYRSEVGTGKRDAWIFLPLALVIAAAALIASYNGFTDSKWITHGFYNGDTATLLALTQRSFGSSGLVTENPFAGSGYLEYPTLLHASISSFLSGVGIGTNWFHFLPLFTYLQLAILVPLFFLIWDVVYPEPKSDRERWFGIPSRPLIYGIQTAVVIYVLAVSWDGYVYPQSHFFLTAIFLLQVALLRVAYRLKGRQQLAHVLIAAAAGLVLLFSNAVTGTAAVALLLIFFALRAIDKGRVVSERQAYIVAGMVAAVLYFIATPGDAHFSLPGLSYTGAFDMLRLSIVVIPLVVAIFQQISKEPFISASASFLILLAFITFFFSGRDIVVGNASRFFYHGLLVGFPLMLSLIIQLFFYVRRELIHTSKSVGEKATGWAAAVAVLMLVLLPAGGSIASAHDNLMFKDEQVIPTSMREILWWIEDNTEPDDVFVVSEQPPFAIPMFTGRSVLRADYWLSPSDDMYQNVIQAYEGDIDAQLETLAAADFLVVTRDQQPVWESAIADQELEVSFTNGAVTIYAIQ
ncbi:MAG: hypothetical protein WEC84_04475 [Candidatus Andersenbacteria bacterium]